MQSSICIEFYVQIVTTKKSKITSSSRRLALSINFKINTNSN